MIGSKHMDFISNSSDMTGPTVDFHTSQMKQAVSALAIVVDASAQYVGLLGG